MQPVLDPGVTAARSHLSCCRTITWLPSLGFWLMPPPCHCCPAHNQKRRPSRVELAGTPHRRISICSGVDPAVLVPCDPGWLIKSRFPLGSRRVFLPWWCNGITVMGFFLLSAYRAKSGMAPGQLVMRERCQMGLGPSLQALCARTKGPQNPPHLGGVPAIVSNPSLGRSTSRVPGRPGQIFEAWPGRRWTLRKKPTVVAAVVHQKFVAARHPSTTGPATLS